MLTCKIGENIINCIDSKYDRYTFKQWSDKGILKCPVCSGDYEYCHGEIVSPYFRHKSKDCSGYYSESETEEHKRGKVLLYNWLKNQEGIENLQLEAWIPETKQRPDIYFEQNGNRCVIEYQCTPIASEYIKRRELYKLNNINDIWILGTEKYNVGAMKNGEVSMQKRKKAIEKLNNNNLFYLNSKLSIIITDALNNLISRNLEMFIEKTYKYDHYNNIKDKINTFSLFQKMGRMNFWDEQFFFYEDIRNFNVVKGKLEFNQEMKSILGKAKEIYADNIKIINNILKKEKEAKKIRLEKIEKYKNKIIEVEKTSTYIGEKGELLSKEVFLASESFNSYYSSTFYTFVSKEGDILTWFTSLEPEIELGDELIITGKVKSHIEDEDGRKETRLIRCKCNILTN